MATREDILIKKTYKDDSLDVAKRVFYTLLGEEWDGRKLQAHRNSKAIALLFKTLREIGPLTDHRIDEILLEVVDYGGS
jgi:hypothetical protein